jgi:hypothetical protein
MKSWPDRHLGHPFLTADEGSGDFRRYQSSSNSEKLTPFREKVGNLLPLPPVVSIVPWRSCPDDSALPVGATTMIAYNTIDATATSGLESPIMACLWRTALPRLCHPGIQSTNSHRVDFYIFLLSRNMARNKCQVGTISKSSEAAVRMRGAAITFSVNSTMAAAE